MRISVVASVGLSLAIGATPTDGRCKPYPAYVYEGQVISCRLATADDFDRRTGLIDRDRAVADLERRVLSLVAVSVRKIVQVGRCDWENGCDPAVTPWDEVTPTEFRFQLDAGCSVFLSQVGEIHRFYAVRPCCEVFPTPNARCAVGVPAILEPPNWVVSIVDGG